MNTFRLKTSRYYLGCLLDCAALLASAACNSFDCSTENASKDLLRNVAVPLGLDGTDAAGAAAEDGASVRRQSYTIDPEGRFTFHRSLERTVAHLGAEVATLDKKRAQKLGAEPFAGVIVRSLEDDGAASRAGLRKDDVITAFGGQSGLSVERLAYLVSEANPGEEVGLDVLREGGAEMIAVRLGSEERIESATALQDELPLLDDRARSGLRLAELTDRARPVVLGPDAAEGGLLVIDVLPGGPAFAAGLEVRDAILRVAETPIATLDDYSRALAALEPGAVARIAFRRGGEVKEARLELAENALATSGFKVPFVIASSRRPEHREFSLVWGILCNTEVCHAVRSRDGAHESYTSRNWGVLADLIAYRGDSRGRGKIRLLWLIPIWWGG
jgi:hypothetical protein